MGVLSLSLSTSVILALQCATSPPIYRVVNTDSSSTRCKVQGADSSDITSPCIELLTLTAATQGARLASNRAEIEN